MEWPVPCQERRSSQRRCRRRAAVASAVSGAGVTGPYYGHLISRWASAVERASTREWQAEWIGTWVPSTQIRPPAAMIGAMSHRRQCGHRLDGRDEYGW